MAGRFKGLNYWKQSAATIPIAAPDVSPLVRTTEVLAAFQGLLVVNVLVLGVITIVAGRQSLAEANVVHIALDAVDDLGEPPQCETGVNARDTTYSD
jgi:hypothetical protein